MDANTTPLSTRLSRLTTLTFSKKKKDADVIDAINKLQNIITAKGKLLEVALPQIVVIGGQSAGKSSVLESVVGRDFLPRGTGTVTRRPTIVQLQPSDEVYAEFLHREKERFEDFEKVRQEILDETMRDPGPNGFSSKPITLKIFVPNVPKLTFVDTPGLLKLATADMPKQSVEEVDRIVLEYIKDPSAIILAVSPANQEFATSDAISTASKVDPNHERTLCVLTKIDIMDRGTDAKAILENQVLPLKKGYIGVVNRSQQDISVKKDFEAALQSEKRFFENHPAYSHMADKQGSAYLQKRLHLELIEHIRTKLPEIRQELFYKQNFLRKELKKIDQMTGIQVDGVSGDQVLMQKLVYQFQKDIETNLFGNSEYVSLECLKVGALINFKIHMELQEILKLPTELSEEQKINLLANIHGIRNILSIPSNALEAALRSILENYLEPLESMVDSIASLLIAAVDDSSIIVNDYPALKAEMVRLINESIGKRAEETKDLLAKNLESQMMFCNVYHWDLSKSILENGLACKPVKVWDSAGSNFSKNADKNGMDCEDSKDDDNKDETGNSDNESENFKDSSENNEMNIDVHTDNLSSLAESILVKMKKNYNMIKNTKTLADIVSVYMRLVQKQIADHALKNIYCFLVTKVSDFIKTDLMMKLINSPNKESILQDCGEIFQRRNELLDLCADLEEALVATQAF